MQKTVHTEKTYQGFDTRIAPRTDIYARVPMTLPDGRQITVTILNISADGFLCHCAEKFALGDSVTLKAPVIGPVSGNIIWVHHTSVGIQFQNMIPVQDYLPLLKAMGHIVRPN
jgi:PilZ domain